MLPKTPPPGDRLGQLPPTSVGFFVLTGLGGGGLGVTGWDEKAGRGVVRGNAGRGPTTAGEAVGGWR